MPPRSRSLRRRILAGILGVSALAMLLFGLPLAVATDRLYRSEKLARLQADATRIVALVPDNPITPDSPAQLPGGLPRDTVVGLYAPGGDRATGRGPARSALAVASSKDGRVHKGHEAGQLAVAVPVPSDNQVVAVVRAASPDGVVAGRTYRSWLLMLLLGLAVLLVAGVLARRQARRIADPLERLAVSARALGDGNFAVQRVRSGVSEADAVSQALEDTAGRIGRLVEHERAFAGDASHQLRTPLTGLLLGLESALERPHADLRAAIQEAVDRGEHLREIIADLLSLRRTSADPPTTDVLTELGAAEERWSADFRRRHRAVSASSPPGLLPAAISAAALRQVLDVLIGNALQHGAGTVRVTAHDMGAGVTVEVADEGEGISGDPDLAFLRRPPGAAGSGIGLPLARSLVEAEGGRLVVRRAGPRPVFAVLLPTAETVVVPSSAGAPGRQVSSS